MIDLMRQQETLKERHISKQAKKQMIENIKELMREYFSTTTTMALKTTQETDNILHEVLYSFHRFG